MKKIDSRSEKILYAVIDEYVTNAVPVSSEHIHSEYDLGVSPATIRADMMKLTEQGYLYQPHTSAGKVPTDKGYRYFVDSLIQEKNMREKDKILIKRELKKAESRMAKEIAKILSFFSKNVGLSGNLSEKELYYFGLNNFISEPEFARVDGKVRSALEAIECIDDSMDELFSWFDDIDTHVYIGKEVPMPELRECAVVASKCDFWDNREGFLAIIGPRRMDYGRNISIINAVKSLFE